MQKISQLLLQIAKVREMFSAQRRVPVIRIGGMLIHGQPTWWWSYTLPRIPYKPFAIWAVYILYMTWVPSASMTINLILTYHCNCDAYHLCVSGFILIPLTLCPYPVRAAILGKSVLNGYSNSEIMVFFYGF